MKIQPTDPELYNLVKEAAKEKFKDAWPSIAGSAWLIQQYKSVGGDFFGDKPQEHCGLNHKIRTTPSVTYWPCKEKVQTEPPINFPSTRVHLSVYK